MTSSLVGSEMCIRDRTTAPTKSSRSDPAAVCHSMAIGGANPKCKPEEEAVSYTHLTLPTICSV
eukprot:5721321-Prorocentrum_lima.AAC.1